MEWWQEFRAPEPPPAAWGTYYDAPMPDGSVLRLPLRDLGETAVAGMIATQASFAVVDRMVQWMAERAAPFRAEVVVGMPTLGHVYAAPVARALGHANWVAAGTSRKLWYDEALSVPLSSITSPNPGRRLWLDPRVMHRLEGKRVLLVDDVVSTGSSAQAGIDLLALAGVRPVAVLAAMLQGARWRAVLDVPVVGVFATPVFRRVGGGWVG